ncbi:acyl-CoA synthetase [Halococcus agarilyticus]|uniref:acyl-CoA synthetase n=1 Tax=Halococcus agarilyticus TaxID=1232219 RepID=UPI0006782827|nr:AMP-binding protein [Halococcus agarilyticus]
MNPGYDLPEPDSDAPDPWSGFEWQLGESYNIATVALDGTEPDRPALRHVSVDGEQLTLSYGDLTRAVDATAAELASIGVGPGDTVGVCLPQCPELLVTHLAAFERGAVVVPLSMLLGDDSLSYSLKHSGAAALVADEERLARFDLDLSEITVLAVSPTVSDTPLGGLSAHTTLGRNVESCQTAPDDPALIMYTSGTTGKPKGVVQGHQFLAGSLPGYQAWFEMFSRADMRDARVWTPAEWAWAGALFDVVFPTLALGGTVVSRERRSGFDPDAALELIEQERVTNAFLPPTALGRIKNEGVVGDYDTASLDTVLCGGEKLPESLHSWAEKTLEITVNESYGQTEANALIGNCRRAYSARLGSMGRPYPGHDIVLVDEDGTEVPNGEVGEIAVRLPDPVVFLRYHGDDPATRAKFDGDLFLTGDLAVRDEAGYLRHQGRKDDLILTSGYRVSPHEVEAALLSHPDVTDAVVGGVSDDERGQRITAYVVPSGRVPDAERLREHVRDELGAHKVPREIVIVQEIPETRTGKTDRGALFDE